MKSHIMIMLLLFLAALMSGCVSEIKQISADNQFRVESGSMEPALKEGEIATVERVDFSEIQVGDIVMIQPVVAGGKKPLLFTRIVSIDREKGTFTAKADANQASLDLEKNASSQIIIGKVVTGGFLPSPGRYSCSDSDGQDYFARGTVKYAYKSWWGKSRTRTYTDRCADAKTLYEYYCSKNRIRAERYSCPDGCKDGACVKACVDTTWKPDNSEVCSGGGFTQKSNCGNTRQSTGTKTCPSGYTCKDGTCISEGELPPATETVIFKEITEKQFLWPSDRGYSTDTKAILEEFYRQYSDGYDFIAFFIQGPVSFSGSYAISRDIPGIGMDPISFPWYNFTTNLKSTVTIDLYGPYKMYKDINQEPEVKDHLLRTILHEIGHHWCCHLNITTQNPMPGHPPYNTDLFYGDPDYADIMGYNHWIIENGNETCVDINAQGTKSRFSDLVLYLMGLKSPAEVAPIKVHDFEPKPGDWHFNDWGPSCNEEHTFIGTREISIQEIIEINGVRAPSYAESQKRFYIAFIVVVPVDQEADSGFVEYVDRYKELLPNAWYEATDSKSKIVFHSSSSS